jgi:glycosyltransferase involved in cell wall biosynthesis
MTPAQLFWLQRQLFSMASALWDRVYPRADIYHAQTQHYAGIAAVLAARQHARKSVVTEHGLYVRDAINLLLRRPVDREVDPRVDAPTDQHEESLATWMNWFYHGGELVYEAADVFTYQYRQNIESARRLGAKPEKIRTIVNGIDGDRFAMTRQLVERRHGQRRQSNSWTWKVALVGRVVELKGVMDLIHAAEIIRDSRRANVLIEVMGPLDDDPEFVARCHREIQTLGLGNLIQLVGTRKVAEELAHVDLVVMPSHTEAFPVALLEAMASGLPVIASDVGCIREALVERLDAGATTLGPAGVVVPPRAPRQLARAILDLMADSDRMERYSRNAILRVEARYRSRDVMKSYMRLYADLGCQAAMVALDGIRAKSARGRSA